MAIKARARDLAIQLINVAAGAMLTAWRTEAAARSDETILLAGFWPSPDLP